MIYNHGWLRKKKKLFLSKINKDWYNQVEETKLMIISINNYLRVKVYKIQYKKNQFKYLL